MDNRGLLQIYQNRVLGTSRLSPTRRPHRCTLPYLLPCAHHYKYLAKKGNHAWEKFSPDRIIGTLQNMNFLKVTGEGYIPTSQITCMVQPASEPTPR